MIQSQDIVIGELSTVKILLLWIPLTLLLIVVMIPLGQGVRLIEVLSVLFVGFLWLMSSRAVYIVLFRGRLGLYVRDGVVHEALSGASAPLDMIRVAYRYARRSGLRTTLLMEVRGPKPISPAYPELNRYEELSVSALSYRTPIAVMLERLEACGVKIKGSKTTLLGI